MGVDIYTYIECFEDQQWILVDPGEVEEFFGFRNYRIFGFLADVRRYEDHPVIDSLRGVPEDVSLDTEENLYELETSWVILKELLDFDYEQTFELDGSSISMRAYLPKYFFDELRRLKNYADALDLDPKDVRIVFQFDF